MNPKPLVVPHPHIAGAYTLASALATPGAHIPMFANKQSAEMATTATDNLKRRDK